VRPAGLARRDGNRRYYDLVERLFPADLLAIRIPSGSSAATKLLSRIGRTVYWAPRAAPSYGWGLDRRRCGRSSVPS